MCIKKVVIVLRRHYLFFKAPPSFLTCIKSNLKKALRSHFFKSAKPLQTHYLYLILANFLEWLWNLCYAMFHRILPYTNVNAFHAKPIKTETLIKSLWFFSLQWNKELNDDLYIFYKLVINICFKLMTINYIRNLWSIRKL